MRLWVRASCGVYCGACGDQVEAGLPVLEISRATWKLHRCERCAGEPVPDVLPERLIPKQTITPTFLHPRAAGELARDWKQKQMGEDS